MIKKILTVYLAGKIEGLNLEQAGGWRSEAIKKLQDNSLVGYCPIFHGLDLSSNASLKDNQNLCDEIFEVDLDLIWRSDCLLVNFSTGLSFGTCQEVFYASNILNLPVFAFGYTGQSAFAFATIDKFYDTIDEAIEGMIRYNEAYPGNSLVSSNKYKLPPERLKPRNA